WDTKIQIFTCSKVTSAVANSMYVYFVIAGSANVSFKRPLVIPSGIAIIYVIINVANESQKVFIIRSVIKSVTAILNLKDWPKSHWTAPDTQSAYCIYHGSFNPSFSLCASNVSGSIFGSIRPDNASPG